MLAHKLYSFYFSFLLLSLNSAFAQQPKLILPSVHSNEVDAATISRDNKLYASADLDGILKVWEANTGKLLNSIDTKSAADPIVDIAFTPDNNSVIVVSYDSTRIFNLENNTSFLLGIQGLGYAVEVSPDGKWIATARKEDVSIWDAKTFQLIHSFHAKYTDGLMDNIKITFSEDSKLLVSDPSEGSVKIWLTKDWKLLRDFEGDFFGFAKDTDQIAISDSTRLITIWNIITSKKLITFAGTESVDKVQFHPDGKKILTSSRDDSCARLWDISTGKLLQAFNYHQHPLTLIRYAPDGKTFVLADDDGICSIWDTKTGKLLHSFDAAPGEIDEWVFLDYLNKSSQILTVVQTHYDRISRWNVSTGTRDSAFELDNERLTSICLSHDEKLLLTTSRHGMLRIIDAQTGTILSSGQVQDSWATSADFSPDDSLIAVGGLGKEFGIFNRFTGEIFMIPRLTTLDSKVKFSPDGKYLLSTGLFSLQLIRVGDTLPSLIEKDTYGSSEPKFSPDGAYLIAPVKKKIKIWSVSTQQVITEVDIENERPENIEMSHDSKYFLCVDRYKKQLTIWETATGKMVKTLENVSNAIFNLNNDHVTIFYNKGGVYIRSLTDNSVVKFVMADAKSSGPFHLTNNEKFLVSKGNQSIWDFNTGKLLAKFDGEEIAISKSGKFLYVLNKDVVEVYNMDNFTLAYRHYSVDEDDYIIEDNYGRFDGSEAARKLLYFTCGKEAIALEQLKDQLWVPGLAERTMKGETINAKKLDELNICGLTPLIEEINNFMNEYHFKITPRRGGLGETVLLVNGIEAKRYKPGQLKKNAGIYELLVKKEEIQNFFVPGKENLVTVKASTADNNISSRGLIIKEDKTKEATTPPNLYAVMVGISNYKGDELDLKFAAKDATDISAAVANAAKKLLNTDSKEHVFMYNLTTAKEHYQLPEKNNIKKVLEEIGKKATANDVLLIFFAGHGVMQGDKKQFYFLTADASKTSATDAIADVGISTAELTEWMKPQNIKAQKRILIFDACNSGQAIKDFVKLGNDNQNYLAARNDDKAQQIKAIDKLNEKSGLFILSASASNQSAYEMGRYSQGLLTYSLLKAIKQQPDILEDGKYLNVSRWFNAAEKTVSELSKENGARQEPQIVSNTNFNIGVVDDEVMAKIVLPQEKPLFAASNFQNADENIMADDLGLNKLTDQQLNEISSRGVDATISYMSASNLPDAYSLTGRYTLTGNTITMRVIIRKNNEVKYRFELPGTKEKLNELAKSIVAQAAAWAAKNK